MNDNHVGTLLVCNDLPTKRRSTRGGDRRSAGNDVVIHSAQNEDSMTLISRWNGSHFGWIDRSDLYTHDGRHVGRVRGSEIFGQNGKYLGEVRSDRLITDSSKKTTHQSRLGFDPYPASV